MSTYFIGAIVSYVLGFIYTKYINVMKEDEATIKVIVVTLFSWLGVAMTVMGTIVVIVNKFNKRD